MKTIFSNRVRLEPELEEIAALLTAPQRRIMAAKLSRWARELMVSAAIIDADATGYRRPSLRPLTRRRLALN